MKRKINRVGQNTLTVSLPAQWAKKHGIEVGAEVDLAESGSSLIINSNASVPLGKKKIDTKRFGFFHQNFITNVYHIGYDEVEVHFKDENEFKNIQERLNQYIGFEIVDQGEGYCIIRDIGGSSELEFNNVLRRTFIMLLDMSEKCADAIEKKEFDRLKEIRLLEAMNNKFTDYCRRVLNRKGYEDSRKVTVIYTLVHDLERICDEYKHICDHFGKERTSVSPALMKLFHDLNRYIRTYYELFYKYDQDKLLFLLEKGRSIAIGIEKFLGKKSRSDSVLAHHLLSVAKGMYELNYTYVELNI